MNKEELLLTAFDIGSPELKPSLLFWDGDKMMITKKDKEGIYQTKEAIKDPNYAGNRYVWQEEVTS